MLPLALAFTVMASPTSPTTAVRNPSPWSAPAASTHAPVGIAFAMGALASLLGAWTAFSLAVAPHPYVPKVLALSPGRAAKCAACLAATYVGGSANLFVVAQTVGLDGDAATLGAIASADVVLMGVYFAGLLAASRSHALDRLFGKRSVSLPSQDGVVAGTSPPPHRDAPNSGNLQAAARAPSLNWETRLAQWRTLALGGPVVVALALAALQLSSAAAARITLVPGTSTLSLTILAAAAARFLRFASREAPVLDSALNHIAPSLAILSLNVFFAAVGATARVSRLVQAGPAVLGLTTITLGECRFLICPCLCRMRS